MSAITIRHHRLGAGAGCTVHSRGAQVALKRPQGQEGRAPKSVGNSEARDRGSGRRF